MTTQYNVSSRICSELPVGVYVGRNCSVSKVQLTVWGNRGNYNCTRYLVCDVRLSGMRSFFVVHSVYVIINQYVFHHLVCLGNTLTRTRHGYSSKVLILPIQSYNMCWMILDQELRMRTIQGSVSHDKVFKISLRI